MCKIHVPIEHDFYMYQSFQDGERREILRPIVLKITLECSINKKKKKKVVTQRQAIPAKSE